MKGAITDGSHDIYFHPPNIPSASHHRAISANTPHPRYSRVYAA